jgi:catechol 2,3-dioxygenase-like lactoylglutathione lyase family enzyme
MAGEASPLNDLTRPALTHIAPFLIVRDVPVSVAFYRDRLGFELTHAAPDPDPFFAMVRRDGVSIMMKAILPEVLPLPNPQRHPWAAWDAFIHTPDPDALAAELTSRGVPLHAPLADTEDNLRGFAIQDPDGYVLFFGRPR